MYKRIYFYNKQTFYFDFMKKILYLLVALLFVGGCQQIDIEKDLQPEATPNITETESSKFNFNVSLKTASYVANMLSEKEVRKIEPIVRFSKDTVLYIVNYEDGWLVLSGDKRAVPVLGSSEKGTFADEIANPGAAIWFNEVANEIYALKTSKAPLDELNEKALIESDDFMFWVRMERVANYVPDSKTATAATQQITKTRAASQSRYIGDAPQLGKRLIAITTVSTTTNTIGPFLRTKWGQGNPWNTNLPQAWNGSKYVQPPTGCTAVAMAQLIYFTHYKFNTPSGLYHTVSSTGLIYNDKNYNVSFSRGDYVANSPRWDEMPLYYNGANTSYVADLMADVGNRLGMKYSATGSGAWPSQAAIQEYGLTYDEKGYNASDVLTQVRGGMPVMAVAFASKYKKGWWIFGRTVYGDGHTWIIDGVEDNTRHIKYEYIWEIIFSPDNDPNNPYSHPHSSPIQDYEVPMDYMDAPYEEILPIDVARNRGIYPGTTEIETSAYTTTNIIMNWGWDGSDDGKRYSPYATIWRGDVYDFQYEKKIYYKIRKK